MPLSKHVVELPAVERQVTSTHSNLSWSINCVSEEGRIRVKLFINGFIVLLQLNHLLQQIIKFIVLLQPTSTVVPKGCKLV